MLVKRLLLLSIYSFCNSLMVFSYSCILVFWDQSQNLVDAFHANNLVSLKMKNGMSATPLNWLLNALIFALKDSAEALVALFSK